MPASDFELPPDDVPAPRPRRPARAITIPADAALAPVAAEPITAAVAADPAFTPVAPDTPQPFPAILATKLALYSRPPRCIGELRP